MASKSCMNGLCGATTSIEWRKGWALRSGDFANLCDKCGSAYEQSIFCDIFHSKDAGWRECSSCGKCCAKSQCLGNGSVSTVDVLFPGACLSFSIVEGALSV
ncbi:hypothetical protein GOBAR_AA31735 [Gossypium barbadense]|uniref:Uncharacterized protein n=1 Tax=Gossypium barbadense TaxID=3634 RepID=A0A2P5WCZ0_GOSBA|nr:hypothetical protein GOBAR_AA31735 [Gossypium barbadense]